MSLHNETSIECNVGSYLKVAGTIFEDIEHVLIFVKIK